MRQSHPSLASLPADIVRRIIPSIGLPVDNLRLISPTWNSMILSFLSNRSNLPRLDYVQIDNCCKNRMNVKVKAHLSLENKDHFQGVFRGWHTDATFDRVESPFLQLRSFFLGQKVNENRQRLRKIFARCSSIDNLYLTNVNAGMADVILRILGDVPIGNLYVFKRKCDDKMRKQFLKITRAHNVQQITIAVAKLDVEHLCEFFISITEITKKVIILEKEETFDQIFGHSRSFWERKAKKWNSDGSIRVDVLEGKEYWQGHRYVLQVTAA